MVFIIQKCKEIFFQPLVNVYSQLLEGAFRGLGKFPTFFFFLNPSLQQQESAFSTFFDFEPDLDLDNICKE